MQNKGGWGTAFVWRLALLIVSSCVALGLGELLVRAINPMEHLSFVDAEGKSVYVHDPKFGYRMQPHAEVYLQTVEFSVNVRTNSDGYRDDEFAAETAGLVVAGLGDSFGFGNGVEVDETFYQLAENRLRKAVPGARVHNLSVSGYSQIQHLQQLERAREFGADIVVIAFCLHNDVLENAGLIVRRLGSNGRRADKGVATPLDHRIKVAMDGHHRATGPSIWQQSHLLRLVRARMTGLAPGLFFGLAAHYAIDQFHTEMDSITREALATTRRMLEEIFTNSRALGMEPVLMSIPMAVHVSDTLFADTLAYYDLDPARYDRHQLGHELRSVAERQDVTFLDLQAELAKDADPASLFFPLDRHLNAAGHARVGEILGSALSSIALKREKE